MSLALLVTSTWKLASAGMSPVTDIAMMVIWASASMGSVIVMEQAVTDFVKVRLYSELFPPASWATIFIVCWPFKSCWK